MSDMEKEPSGLAYKFLKIYGGIMDSIHHVEKPKTAEETPFYNKPKTVGRFEMDPCIHPNNKNIEEHFNIRYLAPYINMPFTDMFAVMGTSNHGPCHKVEIAALECIEYYGAKRGMDICKDYYDDFLECSFMAKQSLRNNAMTKVRNQRYNECLLGKREWKDVYAPIPKPHAFYNPSFTPETHFKDN